MNVVVHESTVTDVAKLMSTTIYNYLKEACGTMGSCDKDLEKKYKEFLFKDLKKQLNYLKSSNAPISEIKFVSSRLHNQLNRHVPVYHNSNITNHDRSISEHFWTYVKRYLQSTQSLLPSFPVTRCTEYFCKTFSALNSNKIFAIPSWIPKCSKPAYPFDLKPPLYQTILSITRHMKASTSPCPLDYHSSIIFFKRCPYLRSFLTEIICVIWLSGRVPPEWKQAATILIHNKGSTDGPANFKPIALESVPLKIFTSCIRNAIFKSLKQNNFRIEH